MTSYFQNEVLTKRPYIRVEWCQEAIRNPVAKAVQADGRIRFWIFVEELGKHLRVVTLADGVTLHNAFPDRRFKP